MTAIPNLHVSSAGTAKGTADVFIFSRNDAGYSGVFKTIIDVSFNPAVNDYPVLVGLSIQSDLSHSVKAVFTATTIELINSMGKYSPTIYLTGRCKVQLNEKIKMPKGCKYWLMISDNTIGGIGTPGVVGFTIIDNLGNLVAHGTGPVREGNITVT